MRSYQRWLLDELLRYHEEAMDSRDYSLAHIRAVASNSKVDQGKESQPGSPTGQVTYLSLSVPILLHLLKGVDFDQRAQNAKISRERAFAREAEAHTLNTMS